MPFDTMFYRLLLALFVGGIIGAQREYKSKSAGFRTLILICVGSALLTMFSMIIGSPNSPDRIASNIVTGIGFLGAGVIYKEENRVRGLTTAATVWVTAALGIGAGAGFYWVTVAGCIISLLSLFLLTYLEDIIDIVNQTRQYRIRCAYRHETLERFEELLRQCNMTFKRNKQSIADDKIEGRWSVNGSKKNHERFVKMMLNDESIIEFDF
jgi:putative Mg2+ transporter-C (MgtC) family protein